MSECPALTQADSRIALLEKWLRDEKHGPLLLKMEGLLRSAVEEMHCIQPDALGDAHTDPVEGFELCHACAATWPCGAGCWVHDAAALLGLGAGNAA